jgi:hypothetical protein
MRKGLRTQGWAALGILAAVLLSALLFPGSSPAAAEEEAAVVSGFWRVDSKAPPTEKEGEHVPRSRGAEPYLDVQRGPQGMSLEHDKIIVGLPIVNSDRVVTGKGFCVILRLAGGKGEIVLDQGTELFMARSVNSETTESPGAPSLLASLDICSYAMDCPAEDFFQSAIGGKGVGYYLERGRCFINGIVRKFFFRNGSAWAPGTQWSLSVNEKQEAVVTVLSGSVILESSKGKVEVKGNEQFELPDADSTPRPTPKTRGAGFDAREEMRWNRKLLIDSASKPTSQARPRRIALLVGISAYNRKDITGSRVSDLYCDRDIELMAKLLKSSRFGFDEVITLQNEKATREGIREAFEALIRNAGPGDIVVFQFSGHGQSILDDGEDESDGLDEAFLPYDYVTADPYSTGVCRIRDDELGAWVDTLSGKMKGQGQVFIILDSCHSGSATRGDANSRGVPWSGPLPERLRVGTARDVKESSGFDRGDRPNVLVLSACRSNEQAADRVDKQMGVLSFFLQEVLSSAGPKTSYRALFETVRTRVALHTKDAQHPVMEGNIDREIFGGSVNPPLPYVTVLVREDDVMTLDAGVFQNVTVGSSYAVYRDAGDDKSLLAHAVVEEVDTYKSFARIPKTEFEKIPANADFTGAQAVEEKHVFGEDRLRAFLEQGVPWVQNEMVTTDGVTRDDYDMLVCIDSEKKEMLLKARDGRILRSIPLDDDGRPDHKVLKDAVTGLYRWQLITRLGDSACGKGIEFEFRFVMITPKNPHRKGNKLFFEDYDDKKEQPGKEMSDLVFIDGEDYVALDVKNNSYKDIYINALILDDKGGIQTLIPLSDRPQDEGGVIVRCNHYDKWFRLPLPYGFRMTGSGFETLKVFATEGPVPLARLGDRSRATRSPRTVAEATPEYNPLTKLLEAAFDGTRGAERAMDAGEIPWGTFEIRYEIRPKSAK